MRVKRGSKILAARLTAFSFLRPLKVLSIKRTSLFNFCTTILSLVKCYDARDKTWHYVASMNASRSKLSMAEVGGVIYAMGGFDGSTTLNTVESYTISTNK